MSRNHTVLWALSPLLLALIAIASFACQQVAANPADVGVQVEGRAATTFEGTVTTDAKTITNSGVMADCEGSVDNPGPTMTTALDDASIKGGFVWTSSYFGDFFINSIGSDANNFDKNESWFYWLNHKLADVGGCQIPVHSGDQVLYAITSYDSNTYLPGPTLSLSSEVNKVRVGGSLGVSVISYDSGGNPSPAANAVVAGGDGISTTTDDGLANVKFSQEGVTTLKAEKTGSIRSNAIKICASADGNGDCGGVTLGSSSGSAVAAALVADKFAPTGRIALKRRYRSSGPRILSGTVSDQGSGIESVSLRLRRKFRGSCYRYDFKDERFKRGCRDGQYLQVGSSENWSYQLARAPRRALYRVDLRVVDKAGNVSAVHPGVNQFYFRVVKRM